MSAAPEAGAQRALGRLVGFGRLIHPFPTILNGVVTGVLAIVAGGSVATAARLAGSMIALQASIGSVNDLADAPRDAGHKPRKPLPAGRVKPAEARAVAVGGLLLGLLLAAPSGLPTLVIAVAGVAAGYVYDLRLKGTAVSWLPFAVGIPLLPVFAWLGSTGSVPSSFAFLIPLAALAGAALATANALADYERDLATATLSLATALGRQRAWLLHTGLHAVVVAVALATLAEMGVNPVPAVGAGLVILGGVALTAGGSPARRELGWEVEAGGAALLSVAWLMAAAG